LISPYVIPISISSPITEVAKISPKPLPFPPLLKCSPTILEVAGNATPRYGRPDQARWLVNGALAASLSASFPLGQAAMIRFGTLDLLLTFSLRTAYSLTFRVLPGLTGDRLRGFRVLRYLFEDYELDPGRRELYRDAIVVALTPQAFDLLDYLIRKHRHHVDGFTDMTTSLDALRLDDVASGFGSRDRPGCRRRWTTLSPNGTQ